MHLINIIGENIISRHSRYNNYIFHKFLCMSTVERKSWQIFQRCTDNAQKRKNRIPIGTYLPIIVVIYLFRMICYISEQKSYLSSNQIFIQEETILSRMTAYEGAILNSCHLFAMRDLNSLSFMSGTLEAGKAGNSTLSWKSREIQRTLSMDSREISTLRQDLGAHCRIGLLFRFAKPGQITREY